MSYVLPQEAKKSKKFTSLPDDLAKLAEKLIKDKFKEEEPPVMGGNFPGDGPQSMGGCNDPFCQSCYVGGRQCNFGRNVRGPSFDPRFGSAPSQGIRTTRISLESCYELIKAMDRENAPRQRREWRMGRREFDYLTRDYRSESAIRTGIGARPEMFGIPVYFEGNETRQIELICMY